MDLFGINHPAEAIAAKAAAIHAAMLLESPRCNTPNFVVLGDQDVRLLFDLYDREFFETSLAKAVREKTGHPVDLRISSAMSRAGGKTLIYGQVGPGGRREYRYQIAIASRLLFNTFGDIQRPVEVCGLPCADRLQAMQRIMEHEIIHLIELLVWGKSSCKTDRFKASARRIFNHPGTMHDLVTTREVAARQHEIRIGGMVEFEFDRQKYVGVVNRIHHRATVLVESADGMQYSNGKKYQKYYIPLGMLKAR